VKKYYKNSRRREISSYRIKAIWIDHIFRRKCLLIHAIERKTEGRVDVTGRQAIRHTQLLHDFKET
jgi:hypothetical protein